MARKNYSIAVPEDMEYDFDNLKEKIKKATDLARIYNKNTTGKQYPESVAELFQYAMEGVCDKIIEKIEGKVSQEDIDKKNAHRQYLKEYYREYRAEEAKK